MTDFPRGVKSDRLRALIFHYANKSLTFPPTPASIQVDIQKEMGTLYSIETIARYLCDWYISRGTEEKNNGQAKLRKMVYMAINALETALKILRKIQQEKV